MASFVILSAGLGAPTMSLLDKAGCGQVSKVNESGSFSLAVTVKSTVRGLIYNCSAMMMSVNATPSDSCAAWVPHVDINETLAISLRATEAGGSVAACMEWQLTAGVPSPDAWTMSSEAGDVSRWVQDALAAVAVVARTVEDLASVEDVYLPINGSGGHFAGRKKAIDQYFDSMTHLSYRCVPAGTPSYWPVWHWLPLAIKGRQWGFPPTALTALQMRLSHALLAFSGVIWSIDRSCVDDKAYDCLGKNSTVYESCISHISGLPDPHCHLLCNQTWQLGPGGAAEPWGVHTLSHHIPSPGLSALQDSRTSAVGVYGDRGCGDTGH
jgi:hypothetical protein